MGYYKEQFSAISPFREMKIDENIIKKVVGCCTYFETKPNHQQALNSPYLGVIPICFTHADMDMLFGVLGVDQNEISDICARCPITDDSWVVVNDPYNHLVVYMTYRITTSSLSEKLKMAGCMALMKLMHYKFFTSLVRNSYPYGADEEVMAYVVATMNLKFDIAKYESWGKLIEERCRYLLSAESIHIDVFKRYDDDNGIIYAISNSQSNLRQKIVRMNTLYYEAKQNNESLGTYKAIDVVDGEKLITSQVEIFDSMQAGMLLQIESPARLIDMELAEVVSSKYKEVSRELLCMVLTKFSELAKYQADNGISREKTKVTNKNTGEKEDIYLSCSLIVKEFIQKTYRYCIVHKDVDLKSKKSILVKVLNIYTSSQMNDPDILIIKRSIMHFVATTELTRRPNTISALTICIIIYLLVKTFEYIK